MNAQFFIVPCNNKVNFHTINTDAILWMDEHLTLLKRNMHMCNKLKYIRTSPVLI